MGLTYYFSCGLNDLKKAADHGVYFDARVSFAYLMKGRDHLSLLSYLRKKKRKKLFLGSGAFTNFLRPGHVSIEAYCDYLKSYASEWDEYETMHDLSSRDQTLSNHSWLLEQGLSPLFVDHLKFKDDPRLIKYYQNASKVCLSSWGKQAALAEDSESLSLDLRVEMNKKVNICRSLGTRKHLLSVSSLLKFLPHLDTVASVDSAAWSKIPGYGELVISSSTSIGGLEVPILRRFSRLDATTNRRSLPEESARELNRFIQGRTWIVSKRKVLEYFCINQIQRYIERINALGSKKIVAAFERHKATLEKAEERAIVMSFDPDVGSVCVSAIDTEEFMKLSDGRLLDVHDEIHDLSESGKLNQTQKDEAIVANLLLHQEMYRRGMSPLLKAGSLDHLSFDYGVDHGLSESELSDLWIEPADRTEEKEDSASDSSQENDLSVKIIKNNEDIERRIVLGVVLEPDSVDAHGDTISAEEIERAAHRWMAKFQNRGEMHDKIVNNKIEIYESYISPVDLTMGGQSVKKGTWLLMVHVTDDTIWDKIKSGEYTGFSMGGFARRDEL